MFGALGFIILIIVSLCTIANILIPSGINYRVGSIIGSSDSLLDFVKIKNIPKKLNLHGVGRLRTTQWPRRL